MSAEQSERVVDIKIEPVESDNYKGRQWGWLVTLDGEPFLRCTMGGTGACWNIDFTTEAGNLESDCAFHICQENLAPLAAALMALSDSEANVENIRQWA